MIEEYGVSHYQTFNYHRQRWSFGIHDFQFFILDFRLRMLLLLGKFENEIITQVYLDYGHLTSCLEPYRDRIL